MDSHESHSPRGEHNNYAVALGLVLMARGILGFMSQGKLFGVLSNSLDHDFIHLFAGMCFFWVGVWARDPCARAWEKFLGWTYLVVGIVGVINVAFFARNLNVNTPLDNLFNIGVALVSLAAGYHGPTLSHHGGRLVRRLKRAKAGTRARHNH